MNFRFTFILVLVSLYSFSQEKVLLFNGSPTNESHLSVRLESTNQVISFIEFQKSEPKPNGYFWVRYQSVDSLLFNYGRYIKTDTLYFESNTQSYEETVITADLLRQETDDTMHVVDFHFVDGKLYTIQKSVKDLKNKYLSHNDVYTLINPKATLLYDDLIGLPLLQIKDSIFAYANKGVSFLMLEGAYKRKFSGYIGTFRDKSYFKNTYFYNLIDEITTFEKEEGLENIIDVFYDSSSFYFISINHLNLNSLGSPPIYLTYCNPHPLSGEKYVKNKNESLVNLTVSSAQDFKYLKGSEGFLSCLDILEESRMDACLLDSILIVFDFNKSEMSSYLDDVNVKTAKLNLKNLWYRNEFYTDEVRKKGYFKFLKNRDQTIVEIDYLTGATAEVPLLRSISGLFHWEVNDGRLYILKKEEATHWQRVLYSYNINDGRIE